MSDRLVRELAQGSEVESVLDVSRRCGAGSFCGGCVPMIESILASSTGRHAEALRAPRGQESIPAVRTVRHVIREMEESLAVAGFPVGKRLGNVHRLARGYGVPVGVMREAVDVLAYLGLVARRHDGAITSGRTRPSAITHGAALHLVAAGADAVDLDAAARVLGDVPDQREGARNRVRRLLVDVLVQAERLLRDDLGFLDDPRELAAAEFLQFVRSENLRAGDGAGDEPSLTQALAVSPAMLRGAIPVLSHFSLAARIPGPDRQWAILAADPWPAAQAIALHFDCVEALPEEVFTVRRAVELQSVDQAAMRISEDGAVRLRERLDEEGRGRLQGQLNYPMFHNIHPMIGTLSGSVVLQFLGSVVTLTVLRQARSSEPLARHLEQTAQEIAQLHAAIVDAVVGGDRRRAVELMSFHLDSHSAPAA